MNTQQSQGERAFQLLASRYADAYGRELLQELAQLEQGGAPQASPALERRVRRGIRAQKRRNILRYSGVAAAACILLVVLASGLLGAPFAQPAPAPAEPALPTPPAGQLPPQEGAPPPEGPHTGYEIIPLGFAPGDAFDVTGFEQDISRSIYYLDHAYDDNVVLTLEYRKYAGEQDYTGLDAFLVNGNYVHGAYRSEYSVLTFEQGGIVYTMTCKYDINTLIELSKAILV